MSKRKRTPRAFARYELVDLVRSIVYNEFDSELMQVRVLENDDGEVWRMIVTILEQHPVFFEARTGGLRVNGGKWRSIDDEDYAQTWVRAHLQPLQDALDDDYNAWVDRLPLVQQTDDNAFPLFQARNSERG